MSNDSISMILTNRYYEYYKKYGKPIDVFYITRFQKESLFLEYEALLKIKECSFEENDINIVGYFMGVPLKIVEVLD